MKLATWRVGAEQSFGVVGDGGSLFDIGMRSDGRFPDLMTLIAAGAVSEAERLVTGSADAQLSDVVLLPPIPKPGKILCVGVNYPERNAEYKDGSEQPKFPSLFVRFPGSLVGHGSVIERPHISTQFDYEGEIAIVIGKPGRHIPEARAHEHVFGLTLMNEGSVRDWIRHGKFNVTQGKNFDRSGAVGPWIVTRDAVGPLDQLALLTHINGEERQVGNTGTLMFSFANIIAYISTFTTLEPGDIIATGTPPGAGGRFDPPRWLVPGDIVEVNCPTIGTLRNVVADEGV
jgi:2-keto-4-pentenoate hydratase/2-oxohepta-3-ene-1,7-dioic acid hydratase in catechol pathway